MVWWVTEAGGSCEASDFASDFPLSADLLSGLFASSARIVVAGGWLAGMSWASAAEEARDTRIAASRRERAKKAAGWITRGNSVDRQGKTEGPNWAVPRDLSSGQGALKAQGREAEPFAKIVNGGLDRTLALRLTAGDAAHVAGPLAEANLELATAPARTRRLI